MIISMVVDLEVDATLGDGFYYYNFFSQKELGFTISHIYNCFEKSYKWVWNLRTLVKFHGSELSPVLFQDFMDGHIKFLRLLPLLAQLHFPIRGIPTQQGPNQWL